MTSENIHSKARARRIAVLESLNGTPCPRRKVLRVPRYRTESRDNRLPMEELLFQALEDRLAAA